MIVKTGIDKSNFTWNLVQIDRKCLLKSPLNTSFRQSLTLKAPRKIAADNILNFFYYF